MMIDYTELMNTVAQATNGTVARLHLAALSILRRHAPIEVDKDSTRGRLICAHEWADGDGYIEPWPCADADDLANAYLPGDRS